MIIPFFLNFEDGERCGATLKSIFENAVNPDKVYIGLVEQNAPDDNFCIETYCNSYAESQIYQRKTIRKGMVKLISQNEGRIHCPYFNNIKLIAYHHIQAHGPSYARSLTRKVLGNEEFCMQVDAHTKFVNNWDKIALDEWKSANNEFGVLSTVPPSVRDEEKYRVDGEFQFAVPRQCAINFQDNGFPVSFPYFHIVWKFR